MRPRPLGIPEIPGGIPDRFQTPPGEPGLLARRRLGIPPSRIPARSNACRRKPLVVLPSGSALGSRIVPTSPAPDRPRREPIRPRDPFGDPGSFQPHGAHAARDVAQGLGIPSGIPDRFNMRVSVEALTLAPPRDPFGDPRSFQHHFRRRDLLARRLGIPSGIPDRFNRRTFGRARVMSAPRIPLGDPGSFKQDRLWDTALADTLTRTPHGRA